MYWWRISVSSKCSKKNFVAQITLGLYIMCSRITNDYSLILSASNNNNESKDNKYILELIQYKLNN